MDELKKEMRAMRIDPLNPYMKDLAVLLEDPTHRLIEYYRELVPKVEGVLKRNALANLATLEKKMLSESIYK
jgi:hypothetical protein